MHTHSHMHTLTHTHKQILHGILSATRTENPNLDLNNKEKCTVTQTKSPKVRWLQTLREPGSPIRPRLGHGDAALLSPQSGCSCSECRTCLPRRPWRKLTEATCPVHSPRAAVPTSTRPGVDKGGPGEAHGRVVPDPGRVLGSHMCHTTRHTLLR